MEDSSWNSHHVGSMRLLAGWNGVSPHRALVKMVSEAADPCPKAPKYPVYGSTSVPSLAVTGRYAQQDVFGIWDMLQLGSLEVWMRGHAPTFYQGRLVSRSQMSLRRDVACPLGCLGSVTISQR